MKVVYIMPTPSLYGDNIAILNILPFLVKKGCEPLLVIGDGKLIKEEVENKYNYITTKVKVPNKWLFPSKFKTILYFAKLKIADLFFTHNYKHLRNQIKYFAPDIIHTNLSSTQLGYKIAKDLHISHVWHIREYGDLLFHYYPSLDSFKKKMNMPNNFGIAITNRIKSHFEFDSNVCAIYDGVFSSSLFVPAIQKKENYFVIVGRLNPIKGFHVVIPAFADFLKNTNDNYHLIIIGDGDNKYKQYLENQINSLGLRNKVVFAGYQNQRSLAEYLGKAKCLVSACEKEAFGFTVAEAMYHGCEVIGINTAGTAEQMDNVDKALGRKVCKRFTNVDQLASAFCEVIESPLSNKDLKDIQKVVLKLYSAEKSAKQVFSFYEYITSIK